MRRRSAGALGAAASGALLLATAAATPASAQAPIATLLYQNFPNPFPGAGAGAANAARAAAGLPATCVWFDLGRPSTVRLEVFTLRGDRVRVILPASGLAGVLPAARYGRESAEGNSGCDPRLVWDGTADDGKVVPAGARA